jgi:hypothetical protein
MDTRTNELLEECNEAIGEFLLLYNNGKIDSVEYAAILTEILSTTFLEISEELYDIAGGY